MCCTILNSICSVITYISILVVSISLVSFLVGCGSSINCYNIDGPHCKVELTQIPQYTFNTKSNCLNIFSMYEICTYSFGSTIGIEMKKYKSPNIFGY